VAGVDNRWMPESAPAWQPFGFLWMRMIAWHGTDLRLVVRNRPLGWNRLECMAASRLATPSASQFCRWRWKLGAGYTWLWEIRPLDGGWAMSRSAKRHKGWHWVTALLVWRWASRLPVAMPSAVRTDIRRPNQYSSAICRADCFWAARNDCCSLLSVLRGLNGLAWDIARPRCHLRWIGVPATGHGRKHAVAAITSMRLADA